jgi:hypothetical protein
LVSVAVGPGTSTRVVSTTRVSRNGTGSSCSASARSPVRHRAVVASLAAVCVDHPLGFSVC